MKKSKKTIFICLYIVLLVLCLEIIARAVLSLDTMLYNIVDQEDDASCRLRWIRRHQQQRDKLNKAYQYDSLLGWVPKANVRNARISHDKMLNTNSHGFRGSEEYDHYKPLNKIRILIVGDSFTFGAEVSDDETYPYLLQQMIPEAEVINMGVGGYGHDQMLIRLQDKGIQYRPDIVILGFVYIDIYRNGLTFRDYAKPKFIVNNQKLEVINVPVPSPETILRWEWARPKILDLWKMFSFRIKSITGRHEGNMQQLTKRIFDKMVETVHGINAVPIFVHLPIPHELHNREMLEQGTAYFEDYCHTNNQVECFSVYPVFSEKLKQGFPFKSRGHWSPKGHLTVAEGIKEYLTQNHQLARQL